MISNIARVMVCASIVGLSPTVFVGAVAQAQGTTTTLAVAGRYNANPSIAARGNFAAVAWSGTLGSTMDIYVATSRDGGAKWSAPVQVNATAGDARVSGEQPPRVVLVAGRGATPEIVVVWGSKGTTGSRLLRARSTDGGKTFGASILVAGADGEGNRGWESLAADSSGRVYALWLDHRETVMPAAMHHQDGTTMPAAVPAAVPATVSAPKIDPNEKANKSQLYFGSLDGRAGVAARGIARGVCYCCKTSLVASGGAIYAVWRHVFPGNQRDIGFTVSRDGGKTFSAITRVSEDHWQFDGCPENGPAVAVDRQQRTHVLWAAPVDGKDGSPLALYHALTTDGKTFTARTQVPARGPAGHVQVTAVSDGSLVIAWDENVSGTRHVAFARAVVNAAGRVTFSALHAGDDDVGRGYPVVATAASGVLAAWVKQIPNGTTIGVARAQ